MVKMSSGKSPKRAVTGGRHSGPKHHSGTPRRPRPPQSRIPAINPAADWAQVAADPIEQEPAASGTPARTTKRRRKKGRRLLRAFIWTAVCATLAVLATVGLGWSKLSREADSHLDMFQYRVPPTQSKVLDNKGNVIGTFAIQKRTLIAYGDIPRAFQAAIVAAEDGDFWNHNGVSSRGFFGAAWRGIKSLGRDRSGFSTLTMQLVRTVTEKRERDLLKGGIKRKLIEIMVARRLERAFTKEQIMEQYANEVNFGAGYYGLMAASDYYFKKDPLELNLEECALLAGLVQRPSKSHDRLFSADPKEREIVLARRNYVISRMEAEGYLKEYPEGFAEQLKKRPILLGRENAGEVEFAAYVVEEVRKTLEPRYGSELLEGGLVIHTTIDAAWQRIATDSVRKGLREIEKARGFRNDKDTVKFYQNPETDKDPSWRRFYAPGDTARGIILKWDKNVATVRMDRSIIEVPAKAFEWAGKPALEALERGAAPLFEITDTTPEGAPMTLELTQMPEAEGALLAVESATGEIKAMVGGYDFRRSQFNRATQARRQVGSTIKPFIYGAALEEGYTPATIVSDTPIKYLLGGPNARPMINRKTGKDENEYQPNNDERGFFGPLTFWEALARSRNIPAVKTLEMAGINNTLNFIEKCGIDKNKIPPYPSMALGAADLTLEEIIQGYSTIASGGGICPEPFLIKKVVDRNGAVRFEHRTQPRPLEQAIDPVVNFQLIQMLQAVTAFGTAAGTSSELGKPVAGKTGTTNENTDAWFIGFSNKMDKFSGLQSPITCGVWVGLDAKKTIYPGATGGKAALPIWKSFMKAALSREPPTDFRPPADAEWEWIDIDIDTGLRHGPGTVSTRIRTLLFRRGSAPVGETSLEIAALIASAKSKANVFVLEERPWGVPTKFSTLINDPNDY